MLDPLTPLLAWERAADAPLEAVWRALQHPEFDHAASALAAGMLRVVPDDRAFWTLARDAGRYAGALAALHLALADALTLPALSRTCAASGLLSPSRARAVLRTLADLGYVVRAPGEARAQRWVRTGIFTAAWTRHLAAALDAAALLEPAVSHVRAALRRPAVADAFAGAHAASLLRGAASAEAAHAPTLFAAFLHRDGGVLLTWLLLAEREAFAEGRPVALSMHGIARRYDVGRSQLRRLVAVAAAEGLIETTDGGIRFSAAGAQEVRFLFAAQLVQLLVAAGATARTVLGAGATAARALPPAHAPVAVG